MEPGTITVAQLLKKAGYATAIVGKWGLGMPEDHSSPLDFGFDHHYGYLCQGMAHTYYPPYLWRDDHKEMLEGNPPYFYGQKAVIAPSGKVYSHDLMAEDALRWVARAPAGAVFLYLAFTIPHLAAGARGFVGRVPGQVAGNAVDQLEALRQYSHTAGGLCGDDQPYGPGCGRLMAELKELGLDQRTPVFFASDNGAVFPFAGIDPEFFHSNGILRGYKQDLYEGGIRTPFIARWPGRIQAARPAR